MSTAFPVTPGPQLRTGDLPPERGGCMRTGLIGCGIVALLCVLIFVAGVLYVRKNPGAVLDFAVGRIEKNYGPGVTEEDKKELRAVVFELKEASRAGRIRSDRSISWQRFSKSGSDKLSHEDVQEIIRTFRESIVPLPGGAAPAPEATMVPMVATPSP